MDKDERKLGLHKAREGWRWKQWGQFLKSGRRDATELAGETYQQGRAAATRDMIGGKAERMAVAVGAFYSPAAASVASEGKFGGDCCWGCGEKMADQDHIMWECARRPGGPERPRDKVQARLGWPVGRSKTEDERVMEWMEAVVRKTWDSRYGVGGQEAADREREGRQEGASKTQPVKTMAGTQAAEKRRKK